MIDGTYHVTEPPSALHAADGTFERVPSILRNWVTPDGAPGPTGEGGFPAEAGRYHLYVAWNCPWAHRALLARVFKGLERAVDASFARPERTDDGWVFDADGDYADHVFGTSALHRVYARTVEGYTGRVTVPLLVDKESGRAVSNESADIVRMLDSAFAGRGANSFELRPAALAGLIDAWNERIYRTVNNGVYRTGFARTQDAYEKAVYELFETLDAIDEHLATSRYLAGDRFTEADLRLFPTLARFDVAYHYAFKCNLRRLTDYQNLWPYAREIYQMPGVAETVAFDIYKRGYHSLSEQRNPLGIVPAGPAGIDWTEPHGRG
jgi:putative glutathione S-transferase